MKRILILSTCLALTACATVKYEPIVDTKKVDLNAYYVDLKECQDYAASIENDAIAKGVILGLIGAAAGGVIGHAHGNADYGIAVGAGTGAATGVMAGEVGTQARRETVVDNCLRGRGYKVLGK